LSVITDNPKQAENVNSRLKEIVGPMHASPPVFGARVVETILDNDELRKEWHSELILMSSRILKVR
tara:strand:+ start:566 stop:763 length:198 start_codon:yes stop_codon:yes gene_type:complete